jgi:transposase
MVTVLQFAENLTDRQATDAVRGRIDWKYLLGLELIDDGFDFSVLSQFRPGWAPTICRPWRWTCCWTA